MLKQTRNYIQFWYKVGTSREIPCLKQNNAEESKKKVSNQVLNLLDQNKYEGNDCSDSQ